MQKRPFQFTLRTILGVMVATAATLGLILWLGTEVAPVVLPLVGIAAGYLLSRPGAPFRAATKFERIAWVIHWGVFGLVVGLAVAFGGTGMPALAAPFAVFALLQFGQSVVLMISD